MGVGLPLAADAASTADPSWLLSLIAAGGSVLTASIPVLISKMRDRNQPAVPVNKPAQDGKAGRHHRPADAQTLLAAVEDGGDLLHQLVTDLRRRLDTSEVELRGLRSANDGLERDLYEQRLTYESRLATQQNELNALRAQITAMTARGL